MEFTWKQFFELIEKTFEINQQKIAYYLDVNKSTISRLRNGTTRHISFSTREMYRKIFDLSNSKSLAYGESTDMSPEMIEASPLHTLKQIIEEEHWAEQTAEIQNSKYENFVLGLLKLADANSKSPKQETSVSPKNIPHENIPQENISSNSTEHMSLGNSPAITGNAELSMPLQCQKCVYCEYFHIAETVHKNISNPIGTCTVHKKKIKSASPSCEYFEANIGKITTKILTRDFS